ncbi:MAG: TolC family protein [Pseudohongiella sp.]|nr:TolC family protein [Pseudohongiella sp.]
MKRVPEYFCKASNAGMACLTLASAGLLLIATLGAMAPAYAQTPAQAQQTAADIQVSNTALETGIGQTLEDFFTAALEYSPRLQVAEAKRDIGAARRRSANGQLLPQISASASISDNRQDALNRISEYRGERLALVLRQVLFDWRVFSQRGQAYALENQLEAEYFAELSVVLTSVAERYFDVLQAEDALRSIQSERESVRNQVNQVERLYGLQMAQITDLYDAQARLSAVEAEELLLSSDVTLTRDALRSATGLGVGSLYVLGEGSALPEVDGNLEDWVQRARQGNHQIRAREYSVEIADRRVSEQRGAYLPRVNLILQQQRSDLGFDNVPISRTDSGYVGLDISVPLFAGGSIRAGVSEAVSQQSIARSELRQLNLDVSEQTRLSFLRLKAAERQIEAAEKLLESRTLATTARRRGFELGTVTSVSVLDAVREQFMAERDLQRIRYDYIRLSLYLRRDAGVLTSDDLIDIGNRLDQPAQ